MEKWQKAQIAKLKVETRATEQGAIVSVPTIDARYDLVIDWNCRLYRAQVKYAGGTPSSCSGSVVAELRKEGKRYLSHEIDVLLAYVPVIDRVCWFGPEVFHDKAAIFIRIEPTKSGQTKGCLMASEHYW